MLNAARMGGRNGSNGEGQDAEHGKQQTAGKYGAHHDEGIGRCIY